MTYYSAISLTMFKPFVIRVIHLSHIPSSHSLLPPTATLSLVPGSSSTVCDNDGPAQFLILVAIESNISVYVCGASESVLVVIINLRALWAEVAENDLGTPFNSSDDTTCTAAWAPCCTWATCLKCWRDGCHVCGHHYCVREREECVNENEH